MLTIIISLLVYSYCYFLLLLYKITFIVSWAQKNEACKLNWKVTQLGFFKEIIQGCIQNKISNKW